MEHPLNTSLEADFSSGFEQRLMTVLADFQGISLRELEAVSLQNRVDTKFLLRASALPDLLERVKNQYHVLEIQEHRAFHYETAYFDTPDARFFRDHHNGKPNRLKVRMRRYVETDTCFFEVKEKVRGLRTHKTRLGRPDLAFHLSETEQTLLQRHVKTPLNFRLWTNFRRITLARLQDHERITIDLGLTFADATQRRYTLPEWVIIEVKQARANLMSPVRQALRLLHGRTSGFSKYAIGFSLLWPESKHNAFKPILRGLQPNQHHKKTA